MAQAHQQAIGQDGGGGEQNRASTADGGNLFLKVGRERQQKLDRPVGGRRQGPQAWHRPRLRTVTLADAREKGRRHPTPAPPTASTRGTRAAPIRPPPAHRRGQADHLRRGDRRLHRGPPGRMEIRQARRAMEGDPCRPTPARIRQAPGDRHRRGLGDAGAAADLDQQERDREPAAGPHRGCVVMGQGARLSQRREPGALARPSRPSAPGARQGAQGRASRCLALRSDAGFMRDLRGRTASRHGRWSSPSCAPCEPAKR